MDRIVRFCTSEQGWFSLSYIIDWLITGAMIIIDVSLTQFLLAPHERYIPKDFQELSYPIQQDTVQWWLWGVMCLALPLLVFAIFQVGLRSAHDFHHAALGLFEASAISLALTDTVRYFTGRNAPDWYDRLRAGVPSAIKEGRLSFPSIHSALGFATLTYLSMYMLGKFGVFREDGGHMWKAVTSLMPIGGAAILAITRTIDYRNDFTDVIAGAFIGITIGVFSYYLNYPSLSSSYSDRPKSRNAINNQKRRLLYDGNDGDSEDDLPRVPYTFSTNEEM